MNDLAAPGVDFRGGRPVGGDLTMFFKACMKTESLQKMVFSWIEKIFKEILTLEDFFCAFIYSIDCSIVLQRDDVLMLLGVRRAPNGW